MNAHDNEDAEDAATYDDAAKKIEWNGPSLIFDLMSPYIRPGQAVLDIGIGTGLGSEPLHQAGLQVTGIDLSRNMLAVCTKKGIATRLILHDLTITPYPFDDSSFDYVISTGVFQFFLDLSAVFGEVARLLTGNGMFAFIVGDRGPEEASEIIAGPEQTGNSTSVTMYRLTPEQVTV
jgi:predicted TPR repeat methyltransferase